MTHRTAWSIELARTVAAVRAETRPPRAGLRADRWPAGIQAAHWAARLRAWKATEIALVVPPGKRPFLARACSSGLVRRWACRDSTFISVGVDVSSQGLKRKGIHSQYRAGAILEAHDDLEHGRLNFVDALDLRYYELLIHRSRRGRWRLLQAGSACAQLISTLQFGRRSEKDRSNCLRRTACALRRPPSSIAFD
jgi:hypothetical protein